jgi:hypothetical protein
VILPLLLLACSSSPEAPLVRKTYRLAYTHNVDGEIEPCG